MAKRVGIITFHASHNYGSMLQAYALQRVVTELGYYCEIINFRTKRQKKYYRPFYKKNGIRSMIKAILYPQIAFGDRKKHVLFEKFIKDHMRLTEKEFETEDELKKSDLNFDVYISGSDQIWNTSCFDFDKAYFLDFVRKGKRVAYAPSMGPDCLNQIDVKKYPEIKKFVSCYDLISVRDAAGASLMDHIYGFIPQITVDPTLLIEKNDWDKLAGTHRIVKDDYILLYTPWYDEALYSKSLEFASKYNLKVVVTIPDYSHKWINNKFMKFVTAVGPLEFLNLVKFSKMVVSGSFHAFIFSIVFSKHYYAYKGKFDDRMVSLINALDIKLEENTPLNDIEILEEKLQDNEIKINSITTDSIAFLKKGLNLKE